MDVLRVGRSYGVLPHRRGKLWLLLAVAIMVVYIVLGFLYESYIHPRFTSS